MTLNEYQKKAVSTAIYPVSAKLIYSILGLKGEVGEVAEKMKKILRDNDGIISEDKKKEIAKDLGMSLDDIAQLNVEKLQSRKERGQIKGSGDNR